MRHGQLGLVVILALLGTGCGSVEAPEDVATPAGHRQLGPRYGITVTLPAGWDGWMGRGALHAASFALPKNAPGWIRTATMRLRPGDVLVTIFENEPRRGEPVDVDEYPEPDGPLRLGARDFQPFDGVTEDSRATGHGFARRTFRLSDRLFVLFAEAGERAPRRATLGALNELLASLAVEPGDFYPGTAAPPRFPATDGWFVGSSAPDEARAEGEFTTAWASTIPYADEWNALPPFETLRRLPRDGIAIWVGVSRSNRFPPERAGDVVVAKREPPFKLADFERREGWEGQVGEVPEYLLLTSVRGQYGVDLRVYFGRRNPSDEAVAEADAMLSRLRLPDWGHWETG